jgi:hypothetical protein
MPIQFLCSYTVPDRGTTTSTQGRFAQALRPPIGQPLCRPLSPRRYALPPVTYFLSPPQCTRSLKQSSSQRVNSLILVPGGHFAARPRGNNGRDRNFPILRGTENYQLFLCTTFPVHCTYWSRQATNSHFIPILFEIRHFVSEEKVDILLKRQQQGVIITHELH